MHNRTIIRGSVSELVRALCLDYPRRADAIYNHSVSGRVENEFKYYNYKIFDAAAEIVGEAMAENFIREIAERTGYASSEVRNMCETTYKTHKRDTAVNIARKLYLIDN